MKKIIIAAALLMSSSAFAQKAVFSGSDTLAGAMTDAIIAGGLDEIIQYTGGGSGTGEKNLLAGVQGIAPMSRGLTPEAQAQLSAKGLSVIEHVLALDGISMFVSTKNGIAALDLKTIARIYTCEFTKWEQIPGSTVKGDIKAYRRNDESGTTDAFKAFTGIKGFGACVTIVESTTDISQLTSRDPLAIGYAGLSGKVADNREVAIQSAPGATAVLPSVAAIRDFSYPMARRLYVYEISGAAAPNEAEAIFLSLITDRSFMDPIMQAHEFITID